MRPAGLCISSLRAMLRLWVMTVCTDMYSCSAISLFVSPLTTPVIISFSRWLKGSFALVSESMFNIDDTVLPMVGSSSYMDMTPSYCVYLAVIEIRINDDNVRLMYVYRIIKHIHSRHSNDIDSKLRNVFQSVVKSAAYDYGTLGYYDADCIVHLLFSFSNRNTAGTSKKSSSRQCMASSFSHENMSNNTELSRLLYAFAG